MQYIIDDNTAINNINYGQVSIFIDACFLLAYIDLDDTRGDKVSILFDKWSKDQVKEIVISNHIASEIIHNIFKNHIRETLVIIHKVLHRGYTLTDDDRKVIGDLHTAQRLYRLVPSQLITKLINSGELPYDIGKLIKDFKINFSNFRDHLHHYYLRSVETYKNTINDLRTDLNLTIQTPIVDEEEVEMLALSNMRTLQLDAHDAFHLATSLNHQCDFFITLDGDYFNNYYSSENLGTLKILKVG